MIVEMAGRPAGHLTESLEKHIGVLRDVDDVEVHEIKVSEPREIPSKVEGQESEVREEEKMFTTFAEADFEVPSFARLSETMFDFMPSSVEVVEPSKVSLEATEATDLLNNISGRMHRYDEIAKIAGARLQQMGAQLQAMQKALIERDEEIVKLKEGTGKKKAIKKGKKTGQSANSKLVKK